MTTFPFLIAKIGSVHDGSSPFSIEVGLLEAGGVAAYRIPPGAEFTGSPRLSG